jgi:hypothetical protein
MNSSYPSWNNILVPGNKGIIFFANVEQITKFVEGTKF